MFGAEAGTSVAVPSLIEDRPPARRVVDPSKNVRRRRGLRVGGHATTDADAPISFDAGFYGTYFPSLSVFPG